ncbi:hypothetical protein TI39_contig4246g00005 [Zymoseptoria brevis]|uniref:Uncharacterized protein n=1 Tax=Zymoseptoria brevis TaxID=1047168 RepID=A0A0F4G8X7_9PEZI|nr:hypothetical protein TI39_contig4246g00005 [Zymoseptoria brevis]
MASAYTDNRFRSNAHTGPRATPTLPKGGLFSIYAETEIPTPAKFPYEALLDVRKYHEWNTYIIDVLITKHSNPHSRTLKMEQGTFMTFTVQMTPEERTSTKEVVRHLEPLKTRAANNSTTGKYVTRIRWTMDNAGILAPGFMLKTERVNEIEELEDGTTVYKTWLSFGGLGAKFVKKKYEKALQGKLSDFCHDLKRRSVQLQKKEEAERASQ